LILKEIQHYLHKMKGEIGGITTTTHY